MKLCVPVSPGERYYYSDVTITCQKFQPDQLYLANRWSFLKSVPTRPGGRTWGEKKDAYRQLQSLQAYVLVERDAPHGVVYRRQVDVFTREDYEGLEGEIPLPEVEMTVPLAEVYARVDFSAMTATEEES
jgi:hypothetical protein